MKHYKFQLNGQTITLSYDGNGDSLQNFLIDGKAPQVSGEQLPAFVAAIVLALFEHDVEVVHAQTQLGRVGVSGRTNEREEQYLQ